jgi:hypothetical protein
MFLNGSWQNVTSPHVVEDQSLKSGVKVRAIDKAGNVREGNYVASAVPPRQSGLGDYLALVAIVLLLAGALIARYYLNKRRAAQSPTIDLRS